MLNLRYLYADWSFCLYRFIFLALRKNSIFFELPSSSMMLALIKRILSPCKLLHWISFLNWEVLDVGGLLLQVEFKLFIQCSKSVNLLGIILMVILHVGVLFKKQLALELKIRSPLEFDSDFAEFILGDGKLILEWTDFALVVLEVVFGELI